MLFLRKSHPDLASLPASAGPAVFRSSQRSFAHAGPYRRTYRASSLLQLLYAAIMYSKPTSRERELVLQRLSSLLRSEAQSARSLSLGLEV